jgi:hypothetical protein
LKPLQQTINALRERQRATRQLIPDPGYRHVTTSILTADAAYGACAQVLKALDRSIAKQLSGNLSDKGLRASFPAIADDLIACIRSADSLAKSRDRIVAKRLGKTLLWGTIKWGSKLLPVRYSDLKDVEEVFSAFRDVASVRSALRERKNQALIAVTFLRWSEVATVVAMTWAAEATRLLDAVTGAPSRTREKRLEEVQLRMVAEATANPAP